MERWPKGALIGGAAGGVLGGVVGGLTTTKGHNIWTGKATTIEPVPQLVLSEKSTLSKGKISKTKFIYEINEDFTREMREWNLIQEQYGVEQVLNFQLALKLL